MHDFTPLLFLGTALLFILAIVKAVR